MASCMASAIAHLQKTVHARLYRSSFARCPGGGLMPVTMDVDKARKEALIYSGAVAAGTAAPGKRQAMPFRTAFENYLAHLKAQAEAKGKPPRWWLNASKLSELHIMPQWDGWTLAEMSQNPRAVKTWHA